MHGFCIGIIRVPGYHIIIIHSVQPVKKILFYYNYIELCTNHFCFDHVVNV